MEINLSRQERIFRSLVQHYNHDRYWRYRAVVIDPEKGSKLGDMFRLLYIKRCDAYNNASMGTHRNFGAQFATPPHFPHGIYGIVLSHNVVVGRNSFIFHNVTIGEGKNGAPVIGDNVYIGTGAILIGNIRIGNNVRIGAGCVVCCDVPDNATVVAEKPKIIMRTQNEE